MDATDDVLDFWFGSKDAPDFGEMRATWFRSTAAFDAEFGARFADAHRRAGADELDDWMFSPAGCLALIILLDQYPRNVFRGTSRAYATDAKARAVARHAVDEGFDRGLNRVQRIFLYIPFEHSEDRDDQARSVALFGSLGMEMAAQSAKEHFETVTRFGRFPHRNAVLGRASTPEEREYLKTAESWGQGLVGPL
ncbi:MAG: DUF924 family protein [Rhodospirillales bacterium]|jgi:uncharacterized protein (DUF924 family)|nr:DUF924 family protein [Rhodospirillales bacterium]